MPMNMEDKTDDEVLEEVAREIIAAKDDLEFNEMKSEETVAVHMSIPFSENVTFYDGSQPEPGVWVYELEDVPTKDWIATRGVKIRFIDRKSSG